MTQMSSDVMSRALRRAGQSRRRSGGDFLAALASPTADKESPIRRVDDGAHRYARRELRLGPPLVTEGCRRSACRSRR